MSSFGVREGTKVVSYDAFLNVIERALAAVLMFNSHWHIRFCRFGRLLSGTELQRCFFIKAEHRLMGKQLLGAQVADFLYLSAERFITGCLVLKPRMMTPGFQMVIVQDAPYGFR